MLQTQFLIFSFFPLFFPVNKLAQYSFINSRFQPLDSSVISEQGNFTNSILCLDPDPRTNIHHQKTFQTPSPAESPPELGRKNACSCLDLYHCAFCLLYNTSGSFICFIFCKIGSTSWISDLSGDCQQFGIA